MYVCMYACMYVCMHICMYVYMLYVCITLMFYVLYSYVFHVLYAIQIDDKRILGVSSFTCHEITQSSKPLVYPYN